MASIGKLNNSFLSALNETTLPLANINFDFSLLKIEAPTEYSPLGKALAPRRREAAEYGPKHQTARKLGALFEQALPKTPRLLLAYGKRASEIMQSPDINPSGKETHGPFADFVGADGSSIWAAATSGASSITVHLLASLLARAFDGPKATSVWTELIIGRQREIERSLESSQSSLGDLAAANAARLQYSREELR
jgi:hypothetical protein